MTLPASAKEPGPVSKELPLGKPGLSGTRQTRGVAPGVEFPGRTSTRRLSFESERRAARDMARELRCGGYEPRVETIVRRAPDNPERGPLDRLVRVGSFENESERKASPAA